MFQYIPALVTSFIWSISIVIYKQVSRIVNVLSLNITRLFSASLALFGVCLAFNLIQINFNLIYAALSGFLVLALGDTLYIYSSREIGVSIATPIVYTYVILIQFVSVLFGEKLTIGKLIGSILAFTSITLLTYTHKSSQVKLSNFKGVLAALLCCLLWTFGQAILKLAVTNAHVLTITFIRTLTGFLTLIIIFTLIKLVTRNKEYNTPTLYINRTTSSFKVMVFGILDLGIGSFSYILSILLIGVGLTVILTSIIPILTQILGYLIEHEKLKTLDILAGILVTLGIIVSILI